MQQIIVRTYGNQRAFERDANRMAQAGYEAVNVVGQQPGVAIIHTTIAAIFTLGFSFWLGGRAHKRGKLTVTYRLIGLPVQDYAPRRPTGVASDPPRQRYTAGAPVQYAPVPRQAGALIGSIMKAVMVAIILLAVVVVAVTSLQQPQVVNTVPPPVATATH